MVTTCHNYFCSSMFKTCSWIFLALVAAIGSVSSILISNPNAVSQTSSIQALQKGIWNWPCRRKASWRLSCLYQHSVLRPYTSRLSEVGRVEKSPQSNVCKGMVFTRSSVQACSKHPIIIGHVASLPVT